METGTRLGGNTIGAIRSAEIHITKQSRPVLLYSTYGWVERKDYMNLRELPFCIVAVLKEVRNLGTLSGELNFVLS